MEKSLARKVLDVIPQLTMGTMAVTEKMQEITKELGNEEDMIKSYKTAEEVLRKVVETSEAACGDLKAVVDVCNEYDDTMNEWIAQASMNLTEDSIKVIKELLEAFVHIRTGLELCSKAKLPDDYFENSVRLTIVCTRVVTGEE